MNSEHLQEALSVLSRALPQIAFDPNQPIAFSRAVAQHLQAQKHQHESDLQVMNERMTESIDRMLWRITELRNELRALQSMRKAGVQTDALGQAIRRMEAVSIEELWNVFIDTRGKRESWAEGEAIRTRLIAAARGLTKEEPA